MVKWGLTETPCNAHLSPMKLLHCQVCGHPAVQPLTGRSGPGPDSGVAVTWINKREQGSDQVTCEGLSFSFSVFFPFSALAAFWLYAFPHNRTNRHGSGGSGWQSLLERLAGSRYPDWLLKNTSSSNSNGIVVTSLRRGLACVWFVIAARWAPTSVEVLCVIPPADPHPMFLQTACASGRGERPASQHRG